MRKAQTQMSSKEERKQIIAEAYSDALREEGFSPDGYTIIGELDRGGMAIVYLAEQHEPNREIALKILSPKFAGDIAMLERFKREGQAMASLEHTAILPVYQVGEWEELSFIAMKLATGGSLLDVLNQKSPNTRQAVEWIITASEAVHFAHQRGILHRDIKPGNLLFDQDNAIYVADFGVAKTQFSTENTLTTDSTLIGTPNYLAPEIASGEDSSGSVSSDLYGLAATLYQCLTNKRPYEIKGNLAAQLRAIVEQDLVGIKKINPSVPHDLCVVCEKALAKDPNDRYSSILTFIEDLKRWKRGLPIHARPASFIEKSILWTKRHPLPALLSVVLIFTILLSSFNFFLNYKKQVELLNQSLIERARTERLAKEAGFRERVLSLLSQASSEKNEARIKEELIAVLALWDISENTSNNVEWIDEDIPGNFIIQEIEGGVLQINKRTKKQRKVTIGSVFRCSPASSINGRFIATVQGSRMELIIHDVLRSSTFATVPLEEWPKSISFSTTNNLVKVVFENNRASLFNIEGQALLEGFKEGDKISFPVGLTKWQGHHLSPVEDSLYAGKLTKDKTILATTSSIGVQFWHTKTRLQSDFYAVENQRIDSPTDAWWINNNRILIQVPGALETLDIDEQGKIIDTNTVQRVPGSKVINILPSGDWHMQILNEDGSQTQELWSQGNPSKAIPWQPQSDETTNKITYLESTISYNDWKLTLPKGNQILQVFTIDNGTKILALTTNYNIFEWDLIQLQQETDRFLQRK